MKQFYDISFIGAGLSCSYTLLHFIDLLEKSPQKNKVQICIIDKTNEFWSGIPYGNRSGFNSLIITSLKEFLPVTEREVFINWLKKNFKEISQKYAATGGALPAKWLKNNEQLIADELWDKLYIPRYIFGQFLNERINALLNAAVKKGLLDYELITAEVKDVHQSDDSYDVFATAPSGTPLFIQSKKIILSIGSPPKKEVKIIDNTSINYICVQDMYEPNLQENNSRIYHFLKNTNKPFQKNILILGSNASSLEAIYNLQNARQSKSLINKFYILSPNGMFPHRINEDKILTDFSPVNLIYLSNLKSNTCEYILEAVKKDVEIAQKEKIPVADIYDSVSHVVIELLNTLNMHEQKEFVYRYGVEIGKLQRRAGAEYLNVVERLIAKNRLEFIKGKFIKQLHTKDKRFTFEYIDFFDEEKKTFPQAIDILINCIGAEDLNDSFSELLQNLIKQKICAVNGSKKGFEVNENFESNKNFFVIGPLLSGTLNSKLRIWHAESCPRIFFLAQQLAEYLISTSNEY